MMIACYDVGGTSFRGGLFREGKLEALVQEKTREDFCNQIKEIFSIHHSKGKPDFLAVVVPGPVQDGILLKAPPLRIIDPITVKEELSGLCKYVFIENDLNAAVRAELQYGIGKHYKNFYLLTLSTGIGAGIVLDGKIIGGCSGEFGHSVLERRPELQLRCGCGNYGCWVSLASGSGIKSLAKILFGEEKTPEDIFSLADKGDDLSIKLLKLVRDYNAQGIGNMINAFQMEAITCMGSIGLNQFDKIIPNKEEIKRYSINPIPPIMKTELGDNIGLYGAYLLASKR